MNADHRKTGCRRLALVAATALLMISPPVCAADTGAGNDLGRLFFTPERRSALDSQRRFDVQQDRVIEGDRLSVDGVVERSSGRSTVWINGVAHHDRSTASDVKPRISDRDPGRVLLQAGDAPPASLRVGESVNRTTRETQDVLGGGRIVAKPAAPASPQGNK